MTFTRAIIIICVFGIFISCTVFNRKRVQPINASRSSSNQQMMSKVSDSSSKEPALKTYTELITTSAQTSRGLFSVHKIHQKYFFEIPLSLLDKDILLVSRIVQGAANGKSLLLGYEGDQIGESQIIFSRGPANKLFIRLMSYNTRSLDSSVNGLYWKVKSSNLQPIQTAFDIKAVGPDSASLVVEVTDFLNSDNSLLYFDGSGKKELGLGGYQKERSYVKGIQAFPLNVELQSVNTYLKSELPVTYELNTSFVLLPVQSMQPRYYDERVGYFSLGYWDFDEPEGVQSTQMIKRWRLEPKEEDKDKYLRGELVEPLQPIVYYIDPATPKKWVPYLIQGVNDWQKAFEKAGFKNAIYALEAPANDSGFSLYDARHNAIIYKASIFPNASGPVVCDPRSGEILETHINWYHNVQSILRDWYMIQAGPNDTGARNMVFADDLMGQLIRFVCSHEVGHTLGLRHNMGASSTVPTDSLRSETYLDKNGFCPSIMDYARFNYVAQPEDGLRREHLMPCIGVYDEWAIEWGYRWLPHFPTKEAEAAYMNQWITNSLKKDKRLWWGEGESSSQGNNVIDPRRQTEDLGDDAVLASQYGIQNLRRVMACLTEWAIQPNGEYKSLEKMYQQVIIQYSRYMMHVANNIGNKYWTVKKAGQEGPVVRFIPKVVQQRALAFLNKELFETPEWLYQKDIFALVGGRGAFVFVDAQKVVLGWLVNFPNYMTMSWAQMQQPQDAYSYDAFLTDLEKEIWKELRSKTTISFARRNLQKLYTERLMSCLLDQGRPFKFEDEKLLFDYYPLIATHIQGIVHQINKALPGYQDKASRVHLLEVRNRMLQALNFSRFPQVNAPVRSSNAPAAYNFQMSLRLLESHSLKANFNSESLGGCRFWMPYTDPKIIF